MLPVSLELYLVNIMNAGGGTEISMMRIWKNGVGRGCGHSERPHRENGVLILILLTLNGP